MTTIDYFYEISKIPRESGNEELIANYLCDFAQKRNLNYKKDKYNNVIITKYNDYKNTIILQAHTDMVCEKEINSDFDFSKDSLELIKEKDYIRANKTSLGADNGIGIAEILNILENDYKVNIEAVFTVSEETSMIGAEKIDVKDLKGKYLINMDGFEEGVLIKESASFNDIVLNLNYNIIENQINENSYQIKIYGLEGGHSGFEIGNNKGNSCIILSDIISEIEDIKLIDFTGGTKFNVIPSEAKTCFYTGYNLVELKNIINKKFKKYQKIYNNLKLEVESVECVKGYISNLESKRFIDSVNNFKNGVFHEEEYITTSQNLGVVDLTKKEFKIGVRSSRINEENEILNYLKDYALKYGYEFNRLGRQPGYCTNNQDFIKIITDSYCEATGKKMDINGVHITLETGFFMEKIKNLSIAVISAKIEGAHTINEKVYISSIIDLDKTMNIILSKLSQI